MRLGVRRREEGGPVRKDVVQDCAEAENVGRRPEEVDSAGRLLRRHVGRGPQHLARPRRIGAVDGFQIHRGRTWLRLIHHARDIYQAGDIFIRTVLPPSDERTCTRSQTRFTSQTP